ncbi:MAG: hypothetical protein ACKVOU_05990 [Cytophagales bacterium]
MKDLIHSIAPKLEDSQKSTLAEKLILARQNPTFFMDIFLKSLLDYKLAIFFDNTISLEELIYQLKLLVVQNHVQINTLGDELVEYDSTDNILQAVGKYMKKAGYVLVDFDQDPKIYYLSAVPLATKSELEKKGKELELFLQFF